MSGWVAALEMGVKAAAIMPGAIRAKNAERKREGLIREKSKYELALLDKQEAAVLGEAKQGYAASNVLVNAGSPLRIYEETRAAFWSERDIVTKAAQAEIAASHASGTAHLLSGAAQVFGGEGGIGSFAGSFSGGKRSGSGIRVSKGFSK